MTLFVFFVILVQIGARLKSFPCFGLERVAPLAENSHPPGNISPPNVYSPL